MKTLRLIFLFALFAPLAFSQTQKTRTALYTDIDNQFPDNTSGLITPSRLRAFEKNVVASAPNILTDGLTSGSSIVQVLRPAGTISSPLSPTSFSFVDRGVYRPNTLINSDFVVGEVLWNTDPTGFLTGSGGNAVKNTDWTYSGGVLTQNVVNDPNHSFLYFEARTQFQAPFFAIEVPVVSPMGSGDANLFTINIRAGVHASSPRGLQVKWDRVAQTLGVYTTNSAGDTTTLQQSAFVAPSGPFTLAFCVASRSFTAQVKVEGGQYYTVARGILPADGSYDLRLPANLAEFNVIVIESVQYKGSGSIAPLVLGAMKWGYLAGINGLADKTVKFLDGTPVQHGSNQFIINSVQHIASSSDEGAPSATFTIQEIDPTRRFVRTQAMVFVIRTVGGNQHVEGENSGCCIYDQVNDEFIYLIPNWGDFRPGSAFGPIHTYLYRRKGFPSGVVVLDGGQVFSGLPTATSDYDPDIYDDGTLVHMVYSRTAVTTNWSQYSTVHATCPRGTFGPSATWTQVAIQSLGTNEGPKFFKVGGTWYILCTDNNAHDQIVFDFSLTQLGTFTQPADTPVGIAHACMINFRDGAKDRIFWLYFDNAKYDGFTNTWGAIHFFENNTAQVGHDFEQRTLLDI